jgi:diadenosine tetraphosphate (Ap4A) HIT family hydrolase
VPEETEVGCTFCRIAAGELPASLVHADPDVLAFMDVNPVNPGHVLVVPRRHHRGLADLPESVGARLFAVAQRLSAAVRRSGVRCEGVNLFLADGAAAGQDVFHCHLHVRPRFAGDAVRHLYELGRPDRAELDAIADRIRAALVPHGP